MLNELKEAQYKIEKTYNCISTEIECLEDNGLVYHVDFKCFHWVDGVIKSSSETRIKPGDNITLSVFSTLNSLGTFEWCN